MSNTLGKCLKLYHKYLLESHNSGNRLHEFAQALKIYGDMYKTINLELYVHPKTKEIYFPDNTRLQAHYNTFLTNLHYNQDSIYYLLTKFDKYIILIIGHMVFLN